MSFVHVGQAVAQEAQVTDETGQNNSLLLRRNQRARTTSANSLDASAQTSQTRGLTYGQPQDQTSGLPGQDPDADPDQQDPDAASADPADPDAVPDPDNPLLNPRQVLTGQAVANEAEPGALRENLRESSVDGLMYRAAPGRDDAPGIDLGGFVFRPTLTEQAGVERTRDANGTTTRTYLESSLKGSLTSDWSSHELSVNGEIAKRHTFSGPAQDDPTYKLDATLKLDLMDDTAASLKAGFSRERETGTNANAIPGASLQATVTTWTSGTEVIHDFGRIRATLGADVERETYGAALDNRGRLVSQSDRDNMTGTLRARLGYEISPALIPFIEASYAEMVHDSNADRSGTNRDMTTIGASSGVAVDLGEKLRGELAGGYSVTKFKDSALADIAAITINGNATWSPQRGTDVVLGLETDVEPSTTAGVNGLVNYTLRGELNQQVLANVTARATIATTWRNYDSRLQSDQTVIVTGAGLTWGLSRYLDLTGDVQWEMTRDPKAADTRVVRGLVGLVLKR